jgi:hypothetical protein
VLLPYVGPHELMILLTAGEAGRGGGHSLKLKLHLLESTHFCPLLIYNPLIIAKSGSVRKEDVGRSLHNRSQLTQSTECTMSHNASVGEKSPFNQPLR